MAQRRPEAELVPVGVGVAALALPVVVVLGPGHREPRLAPFGGELVRAKLRSPAREAALAGR